MLWSFGWRFADGIVFLIGFLIYNIYVSVGQFEFLWKPWEGWAGKYIFGKEIALVENSSDVE